VRPPRSGPAPRVRPILGLVIAALALGRPADVRAQASQQVTQQESPEVTRAIELENAGKFREAVPIYREAMRTNPTPIVVLGLERSYAELGMTDSLLAPLDSLLNRFPKEALYHVVHLRSYQILRRYDAMRAAFERWVHDDPRNASPYGTYARMLVEIGQPATADSIVERGRVALGSARDLQYETAQLRAAMGDWEPSARAWRRTLENDAGLASAAAYSLAPAPASARPALRSILGAAPAEAGARRALAELEITWGQPQAAWEALRVLPADTASATAWEEFGDRAMSEERFSLARDALTAALRVRRTPALALKAATAALRAGSPAEVLTLTPSNEWGSDQASVVRDYLPLHVEALAAMGRGADAERLVAKYDKSLAPGQHERMARLLASAWVRAGDLQRARAALGASGADGDSSDASGLIALYEGRLDVARRLLRASQDQSADMALVMGIVSRVRGDSAPQLGAAFLALARGDSVSAAQKFVDAAAQNPEAASALLLASARIHAARGDATGAITLWRRIVSEQGDAPEAAEAELEWARALRRSGDTQGATAHLEHLILSAPQSALLPQARRELELLRGTVPPG
jgi:tetratricopeptide (TPR) repeat protein